MGTTAKGVASGLATLNTSGKLTTAQIPTSLAGLTQGVAVTSPAAIGSAAATGGDAPTEAEYNLLRTDVVNSRTALTNLLTSLRNAGLIA